MAGISGKVAIVTGAGRGIGRGIAVAYGEAGAKVVVASRTKSTVDRVSAEIEAAGGIALGVPCDVGQRDQVFYVVERAVEVFGSVDILVNAAQSFGPAKNPVGMAVLQPLETFDEDDWEHTFRTGLLATLWGMKAVFPHMKNCGGKIINFSSMWGQLGNAGSAAYNATKEGVRALTRTAAREWGQHKINVNTISPAIQTDAMNLWKESNPQGAEAALASIPMRRFGEPVRDAGALAVFLGSSDSDFLTGMTFMLDGGMLMYP
jgi:2-hydroxycyclohexanecarboxyl-CoA dehydrogenase